MCHIFIDGVGFLPTHPDIQQSGLGTALKTEDWTMDWKWTGLCKA